MNILELIILFLTVLLAVSGFRVGFVRKLASIVSLVLSLVLVSLFLPYITDAVKTYTPFYGYVYERCSEAVSEQAQRLFDQEEEEPQEEYSRIDQMEIIEELPVPQMLKDMLLDYNNAEGYARLQVTRFADYVAAFIANVILNVASFILSVLIVRLVLWLVINLLDLMASIPVIRVVNRLAGLALGLLEALFLIWLLFLILSMLSATEAGMFLMSMVQESEVLGELYDSNLFLTIVMRTAAVFA